MSPPKSSTITGTKQYLYSIIIATYPETDAAPKDDWRLGEIHVDWVDFTREKSIDQTSPSLSTAPLPTSSTMSKSSPVGALSSSSTGSSSLSTGATSAAGPALVGSSARARPEGRKKKPHHTQSSEDLSLAPLLGHYPGPHPLETSVASGVTTVGRGVVHLFRHAPPSGLIASLDAHPIGESSRGGTVGGGSGTTVNGGERPSGAESGKSSMAGGSKEDWAGNTAEGEDGSLIAILAVPAWMRPADFLEFIGGWGTCLEGVRMIREATTPNRSIVLLKFRDPLQASDFLVIFTGRAFSSLDSRETCHPIRIHHLVLHKVDPPSSRRSSSPRSTSPIAIPAFPPSVYASRRELPKLLTGIDESTRYELPSCPVCLERLDSTVTGLVTLPCAHTFDCDCLRKWGDSRCPVCRVSHLLLSSTNQSPRTGTASGREEVMRLTKCSMCDSTEKNWMCVVCGTVGCGRYEPGKAHARRHWEESGHVLAMELETQRVWDYKGDNYVHRLIQTRTDGKLVELPSASSLVTPIGRPLPLGPSFDRTPRSSPPHRPSDDPDHSGDMSIDEAGPSSNDIDKMSTIEAITLEYSYLLSSQLEAMRQHYEREISSQRARLKDLELANSRAESAEIARLESEKRREKAERKAEKASEITRNLQKAVQEEKAMSEGLSTRLHGLQGKVEEGEKKRKEMQEEMKSLEETVRDLMFSLEASSSIQKAGGVEAGEGGDLMVVDKKQAKRKGVKS